jgi:hypothetical protein
MADGERFVRWQSITITQLGYAVNLILTFSTASLGFALTLVMHGDFAASCWGKCLSFLSCLALVVSLGLGLWCVVNRLCDFRKTMRIIRCKEKARHTYSPRLETKIGQLERETNKLGRRTWRLFWFQIGTFIGGVVLLFLAFLIAYHAMFF